MRKRGWFLRSAVGLCALVMLLGASGASASSRGDQIPPETYIMGSGNEVYEPYFDDNFNGRYDPGEPFVDINRNGLWDVNVFVPERRVQVEAAGEEHPPHRVEDAVDDVRVEAGGDGNGNAVAADDIVEVAAVEEGFFGASLAETPVHGDADAGVRHFSSLVVSYVLSNVRAKRVVRVSSSLPVACARGP